MVRYCCTLCHYVTEDTEELQKHVAEEHGIEGGIEALMSFFEVDFTNGDPVLKGLLGKVRVVSESFPGAEVTAEHGKAGISIRHHDAPRGVVRKMMDFFLRDYKGKQRQRGGRPPGISEKAEEEMLKMADDYYDTQDKYRQSGERPLTYPEFVEARREVYKHCSVSTLKRALKLRMKKMKMETKETL